jgi:protein-disulfide isomerase
MSSHKGVRVPANHTAQGGVVVGAQSARRKLVVFEDPQCPYCRQFEEVSGDLLRREVAAGTVAIEYRMRCFLGIESVRADNALALAAEAGRFDELRRQLFASQPEENSGGFTVADLTTLGEAVGLTSADYVAGLREGRYEEWVVETDQLFQAQDPRGTPAAWLDDAEVDPGTLFDPASLEALLRG